MPTRGSAVLSARSGAGGTRTPDLCRARAALSQLSYRPETRSQRGVSQYRAGARAAYEAVRVAKKVFTASASAGRVKGFGSIPSAPASRAASASSERALNMSTGV